LFLSALVSTQEEPHAVRFVGHIGDGGESGSGGVSGDTSGGASIFASGAGVGFGGMASVTGATDAGTPASEGGGAFGGGVTCAAGGVVEAAASAVATTLVVGDTLFALSVSGIPASGVAVCVPFGAAGVIAPTSAAAPSGPVDTAVISPQLAAHPAIATVSTVRNRALISASKNLGRREPAGNVTGGDRA
jgi:hypothetical protein